MTCPCTLFQQGHMPVMRCMIAVVAGIWTEEIEWGMLRCAGERARRPAADGAAAGPGEGQPGGGGRRRQRGGGGRHGRAGRGGARCRRCLIRRCLSRQHARASEGEEETSTFALARGRAHRLGLPDVACCACSMLTCTIGFLNCPENALEWRNAEPCVSLQPRAASV